MHVLFLKNASVEGPGTIADHLRDARLPSTIIDLERGESIPSSLSFSHLVVLGGPMAVYEMDRTPYLRDVAVFTGQAVRDGKSVLGVCLGAQLLAHVLGAKVYPGGTREIGWDDVALTAEGMQDRCMKHLAVEGAPSAQVFQWHGDTFDLPQGGARLASSKVYPNQAFRHGDRVYALQFHIEVTPGIVSGWLRNEKGIDLPLVDARSNAIYAAYRERARRFYQEFFAQRG